MTHGSTDRLRILHLTHGSDAGGLSRYIFDLCSAMHADGHQVTVAGERGAWHSLFENAPWPWIEVPMKGGPLALLSAARKLRAFLKDSPVDVIHAHYRRATLVGRRLQRHRRPPLLYTLHLSHVSVGWPRRWLTDFGDHVHVASGDARTWLTEVAGFDNRRITLIPHGLPPERFPTTDSAGRAAARQALGLPQDAIVAAYVGRLDHPKNEDWLLDLAERLRRNTPPVKIVLAGDGPNRAELEQRIRQQGLAEIVSLLGQRDPLPVYHAADALLLPSLREGFSLVCAEAMSAGIPVLRTRTSGTSELIIENVTGRSTPIDKASFLNAAVDFLSDPAALRRMGEAAANHIRRNFTFQQQYDRTIELYRRLANGQASA